MQQRLIGVVAGLLLGWSGDLAAALSRESPFIAKGALVALASADAPPLELHGTMMADGILKFGIFDPTRARAFWVAEGETGHPFVVRAYDTVNAVAVVEYAGRRLSLAIKQSDVEVSRPPAVANVAGAKNHSLAAAPSAAEEARRLEAVMANVRRLRENRRAAQSATPASR
jgi:hypothetical protein